MKQVEGKVRTQVLVRIDDSNGNGENSMGARGDRVEIGGADRPLLVGATGRGE